MKNILLMIKTNISRNKMLVVFAIIGAAILCLFTNFFSNLVNNIESTISNSAVGVIDYDNSNLSADLKGYMTEKLNMDINENFSYDKLATMLIDRDISAIIEIPENYEKSAISGKLKELEITTLDDYENAPFIKIYLNTYMNSIQTLSTSAGGDTDLFHKLTEEYKSEEIKISNSDILTYTPKEEAQRQGFIIVSGFFMMFFSCLVVFVSLMIFDDKISGVFRRIQATPVKPAQYVIGSTIFGILIGLIMVTIFVIYLKITNMDPGISLSTIIIFMSLFTLLTVGFSLMVALFAGSNSAVATIIIGYSTIACILGGAYFPIDTAPEVLQNLSRITPAFWFMDAFRKVQENPDADITANVIFLILFTALVFMISAFKFTQKKNSN